MGLSPFHLSKCSCGESKSNTDLSGGIRPGEISMIFGNPRPTNFKIKEAFVIGDYVAVVVNYPDCSNFEGNKIMVYEAPFSDVLRQKELDPHFCDDDHLSPIARFRPTKEGRFQAIHFMDMLMQEKSRA